MTSRAPLASLIRPALLCAFVMAGCASTGGLSRDPDDGSGRVGDGGAAADAGAGFADAGTGGGRDDEFGGLNPDSEPGALEPGEGLTPASCYNELDDDDDGQADCDDAECQSLGSCCLGAGDCCAPADTIEVAFAGCDSVAGCVSGARAFGDPAPWVDGDRLAPGGDARFDSGLVLEPTVDTTAFRTSVRVTFRRPEPCEGTCIEAAGVGLTDRASYDATSHVRPEVGLVVDADGNVHLIVASESVGSWPMNAVEEPWRLTLRPDGRLSVARDGEDVALVSGARRFSPARAHHVVLYGRNETGREGARIGSVTLDTELCDMPGAWAGRAPVEFADSAPLPARFEGTTLAEDDASTWLAYASGGAVHFARRDAATNGPFERVGRLDAELDERLSHPSLLRDGNRWLLYATSLRDETSSILRAELSALDGGDGLEATDRRLVLEPSGDAAALSKPTVARVEMGTGEARYVMIAHRRSTGGVTELATYVATDGVAFRAVTGDDLATLTASDSNIGPGARADELGQPSLLVRNGTWRLYFGVRHGTRWRVALLASDELLYWRDVGLALREGSTRMDWLGTSQPAVLGHENAVDMLYVAHDGMDETLAWTSRLASSDGAFR
jgi:hypothetical protein